MTTDEALSILDQVGADALMNRRNHFAVQEAVTTLRVALTEDGADEKPKAASRDGASEAPPSEVPS